MTRIYANPDPQPYPTVTVSLLFLECVGHSVAYVAHFF
jgi:hypothetical protein